MASDQAKRTMARMKREGETERVIYRPAKGLPREIDALVDRSGPEPILQGLTAGIHATALNDEIVGIPVALLDAGADRLEVAERIGGSRQVRGIQQVTEQDADWVTVRVA